MPHSSASISNFPTTPDIQHFTRAESNGIIFPLTGRSYCARPEIELAQQLGLSVDSQHGVAVPQDMD